MSKIIFFSFITLGLFTIASPNKNTISAFSISQYGGGKGPGGGGTGDGGGYV